MLSILPKKVATFKEYQPLRRNLLEIAHRDEEGITDVNI